MKTRYQCDICGRNYDSQEECQKCEDKGLATPKYKVGDFVYIVLRYAKEKGRPFHKSKIEFVENSGHGVYYGLDENVEVGKGYTIGDGDLMWDESSGPATEDYMCSYGEEKQVFNNWDSCKMIANEETTEN